MGVFNIRWLGARGSGLIEISCVLSPSKIERCACPTTPRNIHDVIKFYGAAEGPKSDARSHRVVNLKILNQKAQSPEVWAFKALKPKFRKSAKHSSLTSLAAMDA